MATRMTRKMSTDTRSAAVLNPASFVRTLSQAKLFSGSGSELVPEGGKQDKAAERAEKLAELRAKEKKHVHCSLADLIHDLGTDEQKGLTSERAKELLEVHGSNDIEEEPADPWWKIFLAQFNDLLVIMLLVAAIVAGALDQPAACIVIFLIVFFNAILGTLMEVRAGDELQKLQNDNIPKCNVIRDGKQTAVPRPDLVPGDIVILELGEQVPADIRLIESQKLRSLEAALTGEAETVPKDADWCRNGLENNEGDDHKEEGEDQLTQVNMVYRECDIANGRGKGVVVHTGMNTAVGTVYKLLNTAEETMSPLQVKLTDLGKILGFASLAISVVVFLVGVFASEQDVLDMLLIAVSLTVAAVPEGLPACVTICLASGMRTMSSKQAEIRNLHSVETLGSASVICTDKTGTLTAGKMTAVRIWLGGKSYEISGQGYDVKGDITLCKEETKKANVDMVEDLDKKANLSGDAEGRGYRLPLLLGVLCSNARLFFDEERKKWNAEGNNSERPIVVASYKCDMKKEEVQAQFPRIVENPFNSTRKTMSVIVDCSKNESKEAPYGLLGGAKQAVIVKGAPNIILDLCTKVVDATASAGVRDFSQAEKDMILAEIDFFSSKTYRVLAAAYKTTDKEWTEAEMDPEKLEVGLVFGGMIASKDPHRPEVVPAIQKCYDAGIRVVMITGDYVKTAKAIAEAISLLPEGSPSDKAIDCQAVRDIGLEIDDVEQRIKDAEEAKESLLALHTERDTLHNKLDKMTAYVDVYARAKPQDKITIVKSLQRQGHVASMTGDGVNDAPALKQANIGVAMGITGSDVAKNAASMVLKDDNFASIVDAVEEGRAIYANIGKFVFFLLSTNISEVFLVLFAVLMDLNTPLSAMQILWLNLATDGMPAIALAVEALEPGVMKEGPRPKSENIIELKSVMTIGIIIQSFVLTGLLLFVYMQGLSWRTGDYFGAKMTGDDDDRVFPQTFLDHYPDVNDPDELEHLLEDSVEVAQTMAIVTITFAELLRAYSCRSLRESVFKIGFFSNKYMQYSVGASVICTILIVAVPWGLRDAFKCQEMDGQEWALVMGCAVIPFIVDELTKVVYRITGFGLRPKVERGNNTGASSVQPLLRNNSNKKQQATTPKSKKKDEVIAHDSINITFHADNNGADEQVKEAPAAANGDANGAIAEE